MSNHALSFETSLYPESKSETMMWCVSQIIIIIIIIIWYDSDEKHNNNNIIIIIILFSLLVSGGWCHFVFIAFEVTMQPLPSPVQSTCTVSM